MHPLKGPFQIYVEGEQSLGAKILFVASGKTAGPWESGEWDSFQKTDY